MFSRKYGCYLYIDTSLESTSRFRLVSLTIGLSLQKNTRDFRNCSDPYRVIENPFTLYHWRHYYKLSIPLKYPSAFSYAWYFFHDLSCIVTEVLSILVKSLKGHSFLSSHWSAFYPCHNRLTGEFSRASAGMMLALDRLLTIRSP